ncbi:MAG: lipopolysaccharide heptosyltransferase II [Bacteroidales bacterium]|jgi:lipopolysaccharide heptosyltransferase II|nr:lipopolysaccharide heptosyltransferase II [Bacteroidales bacterium]
MKKNISNIVIFRLSSIGDIILTSALVRCLRSTYPDAKIDFVVKRQFKHITELMPEIDTIHTFNSDGGFSELLSLRTKLASKKYDVMLDIHKNWRSAFIRNTIGARRVYTFNKHTFKRYLMIRFKIDAYNIVRPVYLRFVDAAQKLGVVYDDKKTGLAIPAETQKHVDNYLEDHGIKPHKPLVVLCPGASFYNKEWQKEKFLELAQIIITQKNMQVVLLGGSKEQETCTYIATTINQKILSVAGQFNLKESAALLNRAQATVANDTGMLHMSEALKVPVVGIYGPTVRQFGYFPVLAKSKVARVELACRPCTKMGMNTCPKETFDCTQKISVSSVYSQLCSILDSPVL